MKFKSAQSAINQELGRIKATQRAYECRHHGRPFRSKPLPFDQWFLTGIRNYEAKGTKFELLKPGMVKIVWPDQPVLLRTIADFEREYNEKYLSKL
jgi:hypothetical protein